MWTKVLLVVLSLGVAIHAQDECDGEAVTCMMECPFGFLKDHRGCDLCECLPEICADVTCPEGKYCRSSAMTDGSDDVAFCSDPRLPGYCQLPGDKGSCKGLEPRWYYDVDTDTCTNFTFGGCQGNQNNFETEDDCLNLCHPVPEGSCSPVMCMMHCPHGFKRDERGCEVCACNDVAVTCDDDEQPMCMMHCPLGFKRGSDGCLLCECREGEHVKHYKNQQKDCLAVMCMIYCKHGYKVDANGCNLCECREPATCSETTVQPMCMMECDFGFRRDADGCDLCECVTQGECQGSECRMSCPYGFLRDSNDCNLCVCHDPCQEKKCEDSMSCVVVDSTKGSWEPKCVPEPFKERPWCSDVVMCTMHCEYGFKSDARGCPVCGCHEADPPQCRRPDCDVPCPFGRQYDEDGCLTCRCMEDPCEGFACEENQVCEAFRKRCVQCPAEARCLDIVEVQRVRIDLVFSHPPDLEDMDEEAFIEELVEEMSEILDVDGEHILRARVFRINEESIGVEFHVVTTAAEDDLVAAFEKLKEELEEDRDEHAITVEGQAFVPEPSKTAASYSSQRELPDDDWLDGDDEELDMQTIIIIAAVVAGGLVIIAIVVIVSVYRRNKSQGANSRNVAYSKTPQSEAVRVKDTNPV